MKKRIIVLLIGFYTTIHTEIPFSTSYKFSWHTNVDLKKLQEPPQKTVLGSSITLTGNWTFKNSLAEEISGYKELCVEHAIINEMYLSKQTLISLSFHNCQVDRAHFNNMRLDASKNTRFDHVSCKYADFSNSYLWTRMIFVNARGASFKNATIGGNITYANFKYTDLTNACLMGSFKNVDFTGAQTAGLTFQEGTDLRYTKGLYLTPTQVQQAKKSNCLLPITLEVKSVAGYVKDKVVHGAKKVKNRFFK